MAQREQRYAALPQGRCTGTQIALSLVQ